MSSKSPPSQKLNIFILTVVIGLVIVIGPEKIAQAWASIWLQSSTPKTTHITNKPNHLPVKPDIDATSSQQKEQKEPILDQNKPTAIIENNEKKSATTPVASTESQIYIWKDASGKTHYTDTAPNQVDAVLIHQKKEALYQKPFEPLIETFDYSLPLDTKTNIEIATQKIYQLYAQVLNIPSSPMQLKIKIFGNMSDFEAYRTLKAPLLEHATGFFSGVDQEAALWRQPSVENLLKVLTHEASHAIMYHNLGYTPAWIQEGFAEYVETMEVFGQAIKIPLNQRWIAHIKTAQKNKKLPSPYQLFTMADSTFYSDNKDNIHYALAWSLIYFWMENESGKKFLHDLLYAWKTKPYTKPTLKVIEAHYPQGIQQLSGLWQQWLKRPHIAHNY